MLLNQFKTGTVAASALPACIRNAGFVVRKAKCMGRRESLQVRATTSEGAGWLESASSKVSSVTGKAASFVDGVFHHGGDAGSEMVQYKGTIVIMKKLLMLDLMDRFADIQDDASDLIGRRVSVQLISNTIDPKTGKGLVSNERAIENWIDLVESMAAEDITFHLEFAVPKKFGVPGAILVRNKHPNEFLLVSFTLSLPDSSNFHFITNSWVYNTGNTDGRVFFLNKAYLPSETPASLKGFREKELKDLRGEGKGERKEGDRIYDYDVYSDLGDPDSDPNLSRPNLGGNSEYPYPRRMRTGRTPTKANPAFESRKVDSFYIPRDEWFERVKMSDFKADSYRSKGHALSTKIEGLLTKETDFKSIEDIKELYAPKDKDLGGLNHVLPEKSDIPTREQQPLVFLQEFLIPDGQKNNVLRYPLPQVLQVDESAWRSNIEFGREFLAGLNPAVISLVKEFPLKSSLDPREYGDPVSAISAKHIDGNLEGLSIQQALAEKKLFVADYHDSYLPFVERINAQKDSKTYATRALFFLSSDETLKVLALELVLPPKVPGGAKTSRVFTPPADSSEPDYVWEIAKAHVLNNDIVAHQVFSHFTRCHAVTEPAIIASNRQLSKLHPIYQLMAPHFKSTLEINRAARHGLVNADGAIEKTFTPRAYSMRMGAAHYRDAWTFSSQALPTDLINRGMAVLDETAPHGLRLVVQDYPYAADGLELWGAIKSWNTDYVDIYYKDDATVQRDVELERWWTELRTVGHGDKKDAPGWPELHSKESLVEIVTTIQWITSCQHAAVNFGQFAYAGFMPHHPTKTRRLIPDEGSEEWNKVQLNPEEFYLSAISDTDSTITTMSLYEVLSSHSPSEEYIGQRAPHWTENEKAKAAFERFTAKIGDIEELIKLRNEDKKLKNRVGPIQFPYTLLRPTSDKPGMTAMGVPNSITI